jgi:hypothetical protein
LLQNFFGVRQDGKYIDSYAKRPSGEVRLDADARTERDAAFSIKEYPYIGNDGKKHIKKETHYGFKAHIICDVKTELPIAFSVTKGNCGEIKEMSGLLSRLSYDKRVFLPIARDSIKFKRLYRGRTSIERLNGRLDRDFMFEERCIRGLDKMRVMVGLSLLVMTGMAIGKIKQGKTEHLAAVTKIGLLPLTA